MPLAIFAGIGWHMVGAACAASFYAPIGKVKKWSWETTWAVAGFFSWILLPIGVWLTKQSLWINQSAGSLEAAIEMENRAVAIAQSTADAAEKRAAFLEKRSPKFTNR